MRINIVIDDNLMQEALKVSQYKTEKDAVEAGLRLLVQRKKQEKIRNLKGKLRWRGNLKQMRTE